MFLTFVLFRNPWIFLRALWHLLRCVVRPRIHHEYLARRPWLEESARHGLSVRSPAGVPFAYSAAHVRARIELYEASRKTALGGNKGRRAWRKAFGPVAPGVPQLEELAAVVNVMTGHLDPNTVLKRWADRLFVTRYLLCVAIILASALRVGLRGNESRIFLFNLTVVFPAGVLTYALIRAYYVGGIGP